MGALPRLGLFALVLALLFGGGALLGGALDPDARGDEDAAAGHGETAGEEPGAAHAEESDAGHAAEEAPRGLAVAAGGLRLVPETTELPRGETVRFRFRIADEDDRTVDDFEVEHERPMHVIVVRRDMSGYQHLHPRRRADGSWEMPLRLPEAGEYRLYADFVRDGEPQTLGVDLSVPGRYAPRPLPHPATTADAGDGYEVELRADGAELAFTVRKDGRPVEDIEPYLGARGHLVALREGDLAYLHVHPESEATEGRDIRFAVEYPSEGRYGLFLQFKHEGRVHTAVFTRETAKERHGHAG